MKALFLVFALVSFNAWSQTATQALQQVLPENEYEGIDPFNEECTVDVIREQGQTMVQLWNSDRNTFIVVDNAPYELNVAEEFFSSALVATTGTNTVEITFSTKRINPSQRLITFQRVFRNQQGQQWTSAQQCTVYN